MTKQIIITINDKRKLFAIKKEFNTAFPALKMEFLAKPHTKTGASSKKFIRSNFNTIADCRTTHNEGHVEINPEMTARELEDNFRD